jgi:hypothetical protein
MWYERLPRWAWAVLAGVALFALGSAIHNAAWSQGFTLGLLTAGADGAQIAPYLPYQAGHGWGPAGFAGGFFGALFRIGFFVFMLALIAKFFGFWRWRMHGGPHGYHGPYGPWHRHGPQPDQPDADQGGPTPEQTSRPQPTAWTQV